ncbi:putative oxidoreductase C1F5.03c [Ananas comosus]|uniref:Putative oxidoreductase C1F5.03c n=1 Tax=Ananas comosus TaxID=4615 RepID=A0A199VLK9_ANACO|nr:putative oxidoreductase C1F5.03c [Ananas comosus]
MIRAASPTLFHRSPLPLPFLSSSTLSVSLAMATHQNPPPPPASTSSAEPEPEPERERGRPRRVVVCGGGVIGACTAYFLSQKGGAERSSPACAASGKAGGFLALDWCDSGPLSALARPSFALHRSLSSLLDGPSSYGYRPLHTLSLPLLPNSPPPLPSTSPSLPSWIDGAAAAAPHGRSGRRRPRRRCTRASSPPRSSPRPGPRSSSPRPSASWWRTRAAPDDPIPADAVVLALGPWTARLGLVASLFDVIVLRPKDPSAVTPHALFLSYRPEPGAKLLDPEVYPRPTGNESDAEVPDNPEEIMLHKIAGMVSSHLKKGETAEVVAEQACFLPCTEDGLPVIGEIPGVKNCYVATGHSCWGILNGPATGAALAELILEGRSTTSLAVEPEPAGSITQSTRLIEPVWVHYISIEIENYGREGRKGWRLEVDKGKKGLGKRREIVEKKRIIGEEDRC